MKKTKQTLLTALSFTAALQMASTANVNAVTEDEIGAIGVQTPFNAEAQEIQDVYGPAPDYWDNPETTTTCIQTTYGPPAMTTTLSDIQTIETRTTTVYGPPRAYYTADLNDDGSVDVFDVIQLRKTLLKNLKSESFFWDITYDVNRDGEFSVADLVAMQNFILGRTPDMTTPVTTSDTTTELSTTVTSTTINTGMQPMYGPPPISLITTDFVTETTATDPIITAVQPMYGPPVTPIIFTTTTTTKFDPSTMTMSLMYGPPNTTSWFDWATTTTKKTTTKKPDKTTTTTSIQTTTTTSKFEFDPRVTTVQLMYGPPEYFGLDPDTLEPIEPKE